MKNTFTTVIDVIERALGAELSISKLKKLNFNDRKRIAIEFDKFESEREAFVVPQKHFTEIFPYVHPRWTISERLGGHGYEVAIESEILNIKSLLLYYHKIALPDGFGYLCDYYRLGCNSEPERDKKFDSYLKLFTELRTLIQDGIVFFMPEQPTYYPARDAVEKLEIPDWLFNLYDKKDLPLVLRRNLEESLWIGKKFNLDMLLPNPRVANFFEQYMLHTCQSSSQIKLEEATIGSIILECKLPRLEKLSITDIATIRTNSDNFAAWRASLSSVLTCFYNDYSHGTFDQTDFKRRAYEELAQGRMKIEKELSQSNCLSLLRSGVKSVGIGAISALLTVPFEPAPMIIRGVTTAATTFLLDYFLAKIGNETKQLNSLKTHYAIFSE